MLWCLTWDNFPLLLRSGQRNAAPVRPGIFRLPACCAVWRAGVGPDWSPAPGVETRNTMDRCPCLGSSIDLIIAWMFIFCRPQHQQLASRPHTEYFKSSHWNQTLRFIFRCFYSAMILTVGREWWSRHRRITGIRLMLQFGRRPGSFITLLCIA